MEMGVSISIEDDMLANMSSKWTKCLDCCKKQKGDLPEMSWDSRRPLLGNGLQQDMQRRLILLDYGGETSLSHFKNYLPLDLIRRISEKRLWGCWGVIGSHHALPHLGGLIADGVKRVWLERKQATSRLPGAELIVEVPGLSPVLLSCALDTGPASNLHRPLSGPTTLKRRAPNGSTCLCTAFFSGIETRSNLGAQFSSLFSCSQPQATSHELSHQPPSHTHLLFAARLKDPNTQWMFAHTGCMRLDALHQ